jgi:hypothetical protein
MANFVPSVAVDDVIDALKAYLAPFCIGAEVVRGQVNRVSMPPGPCVILTEILSVDLSTPITDMIPAGITANITGPKQIDVQIDFYGASAGDFAAATKNAFRAGYGFEKFPATVKPLYMSDAHQHPLTTGEQQYESRWTATASMQYNPTVTVPQDYADAATMNSINLVNP